MDATCKIQESIHKYLSFYLICPENWVHIKRDWSFFNGDIKKAPLFLNKGAVHIYQKIIIHHLLENQTVG